MKKKNTFVTRCTALMFCFAMSFLALLPMGTVKAHAATRLNVLMLGNSLTYSSKCKQYPISKLKDLGRYSGYTFNIRYIAYGGEKLETYANSRTRRGAEAERLINSQAWDVVILQQETDSAFLRGSSFEQAARTLASKIRKRSPRARILLNCTWAYNKKKYGLTHSRQQQKMNANYRRIGARIGAGVIYSGNAFDNYRWSKGKKKLSLYRADKNHASDAGCYLNACCMYAGITGKAPYDGYYGKWKKAKAQALQRAAAATNAGLIRYR